MKPVGILARVLAIVKERIMKLEQPGILAWALEGLKRLRERGGFVIPKDVQAAVEDFKNANAPPEVFMQEMCERGALEDRGFLTKPKELYEAYSMWCKHYNLSPKAITRIPEDWKRLGLVWTKQQGTPYYRGVKLRYDPRVYFGRYYSVRHND